MATLNNSWFMDTDTAFFDTPDEMDASIDEAMSDVRKT
jgi:hypothetical protein